MRTAGISVTAVALSALALGLTSGCTVNVPFDPSQLGQGLGDLLNQAQNNLTNLVSDPFNSHPYPWLLGGDSETVYYATNLGDIRIKFRGPTTDIVIPGILGPSNIYQIVTDPQSPYRGRELLQPLVVGGSLTGISTDGTWYAFVFVPEPNDPGPHHLVAGGVGIGVPQATVYEATAGEQLIRADLVVNDAKVAFVVTSLTSDNGAPNQLRVHDLVPSSPLPPVVIEAEGIGAFDFKNERLAYVARADLGTTTPSGTVQILLRDLATGVEKQIASYNAAVTDVVGVFLTANGVVWSETGAAGGQVRVRAYDTPTAVTRTWLDGVSGRAARGDGQCRADAGSVYE